MEHILVSSGRTLVFLLLFLLVFTSGRTGWDDEGPHDPRPKISAAWGAAENGAKISIVGSAFGAHSLTLSSSLGPNGWIESNRPGTNFNHLVDAKGWDVGQASGDSPPVVTDLRAHSGKHSTLARVDRANLGNWQSVLRYRHDSAFDQIYATWWIYWEPIRVSPHRHTQWKMWRINHNGIISDQNGQFLATSRYERDGGIHTYQAVFFCALDCSDHHLADCWSEVAADPPYAPLHNNQANYRYLNRAGAIPWKDSMPTPRQWNRVELIINRSGIDRHDGGFEFWITKPGRGRIFIDRQIGHMSRTSESSCRNPSEPWRYFQLQNYWDDDGSFNAPQFTEERADFFYDDIYLQFGTQARVELGDQPAYESCQQLEIQELIDWSINSITIMLNHGSFLPGDRVFMFVVTADGTASQGFPISLR